MKLLAILLLFHTAIITLGGNLTLQHLHPLSDAFIDEINKAQSTWRAGRNFDPEIDMGYIKSLVGSWGRKQRKAKQTRNLNEIHMPDEFDAREMWSHCPTIQMISDQGSCSSCWAVSPTEVMSDRLCIQSNGSVNIMFSANDLLSCCSNCGRGCKGGGSPSQAWRYFVENGLVSGGPYDSKMGCRPYEIQPCAHYNQGRLPKCRADPVETPKCKKQCSSSQLDYKKDLYFGSEYYAVSTDPKEIQIEIFENGPVNAAIKVHSDFLSYKTGVYQRHASRATQMGEHSVRILGWGIENNLPYWLVANSWNSQWGDQGTFKIHRGSNQVGIEGEVIAGKPKYKKN